MITRHVSPLLRHVERPGEEERGLQKADQGEEEQSQEGVGSWPQNRQTQGEEERRLNIHLNALYFRETFCPPVLGCVYALPPWFGWPCLLAGSGGAEGNTSVPRACLWVL